MKISLSYIFLFLLVALNVNAQLKEPYEMTINGVKVIVHPAGNEIVVIQTVIKGGVQNYSTSKMGIEDMSLFALKECGTKKDDRNSFKNKLNKVDAEVWGRSNLDYAVFGMNCIASDFNGVFELYMDAMTEPAFKSSDFERSKGDMITYLKASESDPDQALENFARENAFPGKDYAKNPRGTEQTLKSLTATETKKYWKSIFTRSRMIIVVVADLDKDTIRRKITGLLDKVPVGSEVKFLSERFAPVANTMKIQRKENATNYVHGLTGGPAPGDPEYDAFTLAMQIFDQRHFMEIRSKHGLSYAPRISFPTHSVSYSSISVSTTEPDKYIALVRMLIDSIKQNGFTPKELKDKKTGYLTQTYMARETNEEIAASLTVNEVIHGNWTRSLTLKEDIKKVTLGQINDSFKKYIDNISWVYHGDVKKVTPVLFTQKETPVRTDKKKAF
jgi:zinc protease